MSGTHNLSAKTMHPVFLSLGYQLSRRNLSFGSQPRLEKSMTCVYPATRGVTAAVDNEKKAERRRGVKSDANFMTWLLGELNSG
jgi:hypothetical protein